MKPESTDDIIRKMREALEAFVEYSELVCKMGMLRRERLVEITAKARAALAAPPRNCDRDLSDRRAIWAELRQWVHAKSCGCATEPSASDAFEWLLAPATEKEGGEE